jgi:hypothetical protein
MCKRHVQEIRDKERDVETICRGSGNIKRYITCPRYNVHEISGNNKERNAYI